MASNSVRGYALVLAREGNMYRAELWWNPYDGLMCAATRWVKTKKWAKRDGTRCFRLVRWVK